MEEGADEEGPREALEMEPGVGTVAGIGAGRGAPERGVPRGEAAGGESAESELAALPASFFSVPLAAATVSATLSADATTFARPGFGLPFFLPMLPPLKEGGKDGKVFC